MANNHGWCLLNGKILRLQDASLSLTDIGVLRGYGFSEYIRTYNGKPFLLDQHLKRLHNSSLVVHLPLPFSLSEIGDWVGQLLHKNNFSESHIKIIVTGGPSDDGMRVSHPTLFILITPLTPYQDNFYKDGVAVKTYEHLREFPQAKGLNYMTTIALHDEKKKQKVFELLYTFQGKVLEASTSNVFFFINGTLVTPSINILKGITRQVILDIATKYWKVEERNVSIEEMSKAEEVFITGSYKEIMPVVIIDQHKIGQGRPGTYTTELIRLYRTYTTQWVNNPT